jgi:hypothetical protein
MALDQLQVVRVLHAELSSVQCLYLVSPKTLNYNFIVCILYTFFYLLICILLNDAVSSLDSIA